MVTVGKTILKLAEPAGGEITARREPASEPVLKAMQQLATIVAELRDPAGGWPSDIPQTPENLTPYVLEEASEVLDALALDWEKKRGMGENPVLAELARSEFFLVEDLIPRLLWYAVRSSYHAMRLISGVPAQLLSEEKGSTSGMVRLVAGLAGFFPDGHWFIDLATGEVSSDIEAIAPESVRSARIESRELSWNKPVKLETLATQLRQKIQSASPEAAILMEPRSALWLQPGRLWQKGSIQLAIDFEFLAEPEAEAIEEGADKADKADKAALPTSTALRIEPSAAFENYLKSSRRQQLAVAISQLRETFDSAQGGVSRDLIPQLVAAAKDIALRGESSWLNRETAMDDAIHRLLWLLVRTSYDLMQLVAGVKARVLQPERDWVEGTVRLLAIFEAKTANMVWELDLSTGEAPQIGKILDPGAMVRSPLLQLCQPLASVESLLADSIAQIKRAAPAVELFLNGTGVELLASGQGWESGLAQLSLALELIPDRGSKR